MLKSIKRMKPLLGTYVEINLVANKPRQELLELSRQMFTEIHNIQSLMSFHDAESELSKINLNAFDREVTISKDMQFVLRKSLEISKLSEGAFDISVADVLVKNSYLPNHFDFTPDPSACWKDIILTQDQVKFNKQMIVDLGGIAKGYAVDKALNIYKSKDIDITINAGGDLAMNKWYNKSVILRTPSSLKKSFKMRNIAVASSADYFLEKKSNLNHTVISPRSKEPVKDNKQVSVFANTCLEADALTKVTFIAKDYQKVLNNYSAESIILH
ncbi:FAD:protein FMN transferase [Rickettsiales bacterium]|nr:FAD:protein FMN transferase [Rickettsiales bacterium]